MDLDFVRALVASVSGSALGERSLGGGVKSSHYAVRQNQIAEDANQFPYRWDREASCEPDPEDRLIALRLALSVPAIFRSAIGGTENAGCSTTGISDRQFLQSQDVLARNALCAIYKEEPDPDRS